MTHRDWTIPAAPRNTTEGPARPPCRCGHPNDYQPADKRNLPVKDLRDDTSRTFTTITERHAGVRRCFTCDHSVSVGGIRAGHPGSSVADYFHVECVVFDPLTLMPGDVVVVTYSRNDGTPHVGHALVLDTHYPAGARPQARLRAPDDLADAHRDPAQPDTYRVYADTIGRVTDPAIIATVKENQTA